jgi:hypothetical protein
MRLCKPVLFGQKALDTAVDYLLILHVVKDPLYRSFFSILIDIL